MSLGVSKNSGPDRHEFLTYWRFLENFQGDSRFKDFSFKIFPCNFDLPTSSYIPNQRRNQSFNKRLLNSKRFPRSFLYWMMGKKTLNNLFKNQFSAREFSILFHCLFEFLWLYKNTREIKFRPIWIWDTRKNLKLCNFNLWQLSKSKRHDNLILINLSVKKFSANARSRLLRNHSSICSDWIANHFEYSLV